MLQLLALHIDTGLPPPTIRCRIALVLLYIPLVFSSQRHNSRHWQDSTVLGTMVGGLLRAAPNCISPTACRHAVQQDASGPSRTPCDASTGLALGNGAFRLGNDFRQKLSDFLGLSIPNDAFVAIHYHLDWLFASIDLAATSGAPGQPSSSRFPSRSGSCGTMARLDVWQANLQPEGHP